MKTPKLVPAIAVLWLCSSCTFTMTYKNRQIDKEAAEQVINRLFLSLGNKDYASADTLFSKDFYKENTKAKLNAFFSEAQDKMGDLQDSNLSQWQTKVVTGTEPSSDYEFIYGNRYQYYEGQVYIRLQKDADGKIRVMAYKIKSDAFATDQK